MNHPPKATSASNPFVAVLTAHLVRCLVSAGAVAALVGVYALVRPETWEASQALIIRNEAATNHQSPGKFAHSDEMKTLQETILELARSRGVLSAALAEIGPPADYRKPTQSWPTMEDVADLRDCLKLSPPKGAQFGSTEIVYLKVRDRHRDRAGNLAASVASHLERAFQQVRDVKAQSMIDELAKAVTLAADDLDESTERLTEIETRAAADLAELRILHDASSGDSSLRRTMTEIQNELRQARIARSANKALLALLREAAVDPHALLGAPGALLESQPALRTLKEGLVEAQLLTANLQGRMSSEHPLVRAAMESERQIRAGLHKDLAEVIRGIEGELRLNDERIAILDGQLAETRTRLDSLAGMRAFYSNQVAETLNREQLLQQAEQKLAEARTTQATANAASLIGRMGAPDTGTNPIGPSRSILVLMGLGAGLLTGVALVFLSVPPYEAGRPAASQPPVSAVWYPGLERRKKPRTATGPVSLKRALMGLPGYTGKSC